MKITIAKFTQRSTVYHVLQEGDKRSLCNRPVPDPAWSYGDANVIKPSIGMVCRCCFLRHMNREAKR